MSFHRLLTIFLLVIASLVVSACSSSTTSTPKSPEPPVSDSASSIKLSLGAPIEQFVKKLGPVKQDDASKKMHQFKFSNSIDISGNWGTPETAQSIHIDLRTRDKDGKLTRPESGIKSLSGVEEVLSSYLPPDAKLLKQVAYQDSRLKFPTIHQRIFRLYESKWLSENLTSYASLPRKDVDVLPANQFQVIIDRVEGGFSKIIFGVGTLEWDEINEGVLEKQGWTEIKEIK
ncbi:hypothetical protein [uncultured Anaeromusa sp.]|uniref:hypothetical protein n=1 Tax=uncultured Anaeromusa sp. TaxID=673273 RepID=UPI0029C952AF|nr:hypothetical protein [uncultured Anaeromusa sp.]